MPAALTRRTLLVAAGTAGASAVLGCTSDGDDPSGDSTSAPSRTRTSSTPNAREAAIFDLSFQVESRIRLFALVAPGFVAAEESGSAETTGLTLADSGPPAPFAAVELDVLPETDGIVRAGLATPRDEHVLGFVDPTAGRVGIEVRADGETTVVAQTPVNLPESFAFAVAVCENQVTVLVDTGAGWRPVVAARDEVAGRVDLRLPATVAAYRYAWGAGTGSGVVRYAHVRAGLFGRAGIRDQHLVQHADGSPYVRDGRAYFTATCAGLGFFAQAHWGVFTLDLADPTRVEQVAQLFFLRDGLLLGDHAGQLVRDDARGTWIVATSSWGDFVYEGVHVRHTETSDDVLTGVHVLETERTALPTTVSSWDPGITKVDGRWHVGFVQSPGQDPFDFHPALAVGPEQAGRWDEELTLVGAADRLHQCEGPILAQVEGAWYLLASDGKARKYPVFDLRMRRLGRLDAPYQTNIPHPQIVPLEDGEYLLVTFDGTSFAEDVLGYGTHGEMLVMRSRR